MSKSYEVYSESFASRVAGIYNATKAVGSLAAKTFAPELTQLASGYAKNIKAVARAFNEPKAALNDLFVKNPDKFRECKLVELIRDSAAGTLAPNSRNTRYKGSYKAIFQGYVKGDAADSRLLYNKNYSVTIEPTRSDGDIKYVADEVIYKNDVEFTRAKNTGGNLDYKPLFNLPSLKNKFQLATNPNFNSLGDIKKGDPSMGTRLNFDGTVTFASGSSRPVRDDEYIIVINNNGRLQSNGELRTGPHTSTVITSSVNINYSQKNILIESEKLVDLFYK